MDAPTTIADYNTLLDLFEAHPETAALGPDPIFWLRRAHREIDGALWQSWVRDNATALKQRAANIERALLQAAFGQ